MVATVPYRCLLKTGRDRFLDLSLPVLGHFKIICSGVPQIHEAHGQVCGEFVIAEIKDAEAGLGIDIVFIG